MQIHGGRVRRDFLLESAFCTVQARVQSRSNFVLAATVFIAACDVAEEADALGVSRYLRRGDWVRPTGSLAEQGGVAGEL